MLRKLKLLYLQDNLIVIESKLSCKGVELQFILTLLGAKRKLREKKGLVLQCRLSAGRNPNCYSARGGCVFAFRQSAEVEIPFRVAMVAQPML